MIGKQPGGDVAVRFRRLIRTDGPISVARYMGESNAYYYASRDPLGAAGDFVTAPEISQIFGELAGVWLADLWDRAARPADAIYAELGPGRGTLAHDALRAMARAGMAPPIHLVEGSPTLRRVQADVLPPAHFHDDTTSLPDAAPLLLLANEFLDALPVRQLVRTASGWRERMVALQGDDFVFVAGHQPMDDAVPAVFAEASEGAIVETCPAAAAVVREIAQRLTRQGGAALFIDYGHTAPRTGSTLQAVRGHRKVDPLARPGEADLTTHVDFAVLAEVARGAGCTVHIATQGDWLRAMGIELRAAALARAAPNAAEDIAAATARLTAADQMGDLFKAMAITAPCWPAPAAFAP